MAAGMAQLVKGLATIWQVGSSNSCGGHYLWCSAFDIAIHYGLKDTGINPDDGQIIRVL